MKKIFVLLLSLFLLTSLHLNAQHQKAEDILNHVSQNISSQENIEWQLLCKMGNERSGLHQSMDAKIYLKDDISRLEFGEQIIFNDGNTIHVLNTDVNEVMVYDAKSEDMFSSPTQILKDYDKKFNLSIFSEHPDSWQINLTPKNKTDDSLFRLKVLKKNYAIKSLDIINSENTSRYTIVSETLNNHKLTDNFFRFKAEDYPEVEVIDMR